jgi:hypothetical protein
MNLHYNLLHQMMLQKFQIMIDHLIEPVLVISLQDLWNIHI